MALTLSLQETRIKLGISDERLLDAIRDADVSVLLPLPKKAKLSLEYSSGFSIRTIPPLSEVVDLSGVDYARVAPADVMEVVQKPDSLMYSVTRLAKLDRCTGVISDIPIMQLCQTAVGCVLAQDEEAQKHLILDQPLSLLASGRLMESSIGVIKECAEYFPAYNDLGSFTPSEATTLAIKDMNVAYQLFRIEKPLKVDNDHYHVVMRWLDSRWNTPTRLPKQRGNRSPMGDNLLRKAADVVLDANPHVGIGSLCIPDSVRRQHHAEAPESLMLMEYLAQCRANDRYLEEKLDFRRNENLVATLKDMGVTPSKYRDLLVRLLTMDATHY